MTFEYARYASTQFSYGSLPGPSAPYHSEDDLFAWLIENFERFGDLFRTEIYGTRVIVASRPEYAQHVLRSNWRNYKKGQLIKRVGMLLGNGLMVSEGELWKSQRQAITPQFHDGMVAAMVEAINKYNLDLLESWLQAADQGDSVNVTRDVSRMVLDVILRFVFGDDIHVVSPAFQILVEEGSRDLNFMQLFADLRRVVSDLMIRRRQRQINARDALGFLMHLTLRQTGAPMPDARIVNECLTMVVAGHETTASVLNLAWYLLTQHPAADMKLAREVAHFAPGQTLSLADAFDLSYVQQVLEETMRLYPPGWLLTRKAMAADHLGGYEVPQFAEIYLSPYLIQRHPELWPAPAVFDPDRFAKEKPLRPELATFPFSAGPRNCIGELLARTEMQIHIAQVARVLKLTYAGSPPLLEAQVNLRTRKDLMMQPSRRHVGAEA